MKKQKLEGAKIQDEKTDSSTRDGGELQIGE